MWIMSAVVSRRERPLLDAFEAFLAAADTSEAERQAVQQYMALMQHCWSMEAAERPRLKQVMNLIDRLRCCLPCTAVRVRSDPDTSITL
jgi:hypothetical protein